jgi:biopolymer transport protein ExbB
MMTSFKLIGENSLVNPVGITGGVAEALIATGFGLFIAIFSLFAFNYFSRRQDQVLDELERLGTRIIDHIKLDQ